MRTHIDWLTFTMTPRYQSSYADGVSMADQYANAIEQAFIQAFGGELVASAFGGDWQKNERSRAPYTDSWKLGERGITLFASPTLNHCCVEISGSGCETLISAGILNRVLGCVDDRVTRIDIASDIETSTRPAVFVERVNHERMRASGYQNSDSGETCYVGSQKSDRYARVYRYNPPHPRSHLLRIEHVFRREYAKVVAKQVLNADLESVAEAAGQAFGWAHNDWKTSDIQVVDISIISPKRDAGNTVFWLTNTCAPAFRRLVENGDIKDPEEFIKRYFLAPE